MGLSIDMWACSPTNLALVSACKGRKPRARIAQSGITGQMCFGGPLHAPYNLSPLSPDSRCSRELGDLAVSPGGPFFLQEGPVSLERELPV